MSKRKCVLTSVVFIISFIVWTLLVCVVDVRNVGVNNTNIGFSTINKYFHEFTGVHMKLYNITDWLGLVPIVIVILFAIVGFVQLIKRKKLKKVDVDIFLLGIFYILTMFIFILFEFIVINYRPILINGNLEASYPSSTTLLVMCVMPTTLYQVKKRIYNNLFKNILIVIITFFTVFMVFARLISGVHWITDIIGGALISIGLVATYKCLLQKI